MPARNALVTVCISSQHEAESSLAANVIKYQNLMSWCKYIYRPSQLNLFLPDMQAEKNKETSSITENLDVSS